MRNDPIQAIEQIKSLFDKYRHFLTTAGARAVLKYELMELTDACTFQDGDAATERMIFWGKMGNRYADDMLRHTAMAFTSVGRPLSNLLAGYICFATPTKRSGLGKRKTLYRNTLLAALTYHISKQGYRPTRSVTARYKDRAPESACSIVAKATGFHEDVVEKAWKQMGHWPEIASCPL